MDQEATLTNPIEDYTDTENIAEFLTEEKLNWIGNYLGTQIENDDLSRDTWLRDYDKWVELAEQIVEIKSYPWRNASNVKFPLLSLAAIQFHARALAALIPGREIVKGKLTGKVTDEKKLRARNVGRFMSTQCLDLIDNWEDDFDSLLMLLPIVGLVYKKIYGDDVPGGTVSEMVTARDVIINYHATNYARARITHRIYQDSNQIYEYTQKGYYLNIDLGEPTTIQIQGTRDRGQGLSLVDGEDNLRPYEFFESHCWLDLDGDGYNEPYIVTLDRSTKKVLRIVARWDDRNQIRRSISGKISYIKPTLHFEAYKFLPDPESKTHAIGFGRLLGPTNDAVNTLVNMLIDTGHMHGLQSGFLSKGVRVKGGVVKIRPHEFQSVQFTGDDIRKGIFALPTKEPSMVLFQLLGLLINAGRDLTSVQDIMVGRNPGQNQPFQTTEEVISQGLKVFNGIYKRVYRSLTREFKKIFRSNYYNLSEEDYINILDDANISVKADFALDNFDVLPTAQADMVQESNKIMRAMSLKQHKLDGAPLNTEIVTRKVLEAEGHTEEEINELMTPEPQQPSVEVLNYQLDVEKFKHQTQMDYAHLRLDSLKTKEQALRDRAYSIMQLKKAEQGDAQLQIDTDQHVLDEIHKQREEVVRAIEVETQYIMALQAKKDENKDEVSGGEGGSSSANS